jgi:hypothetical protein
LNIRYSSKRANHSWYSRFEFAIHCVIMHKTQDAVNKFYQCSEILCKYFTRIFQTNILAIIASEIILLEFDFHFLVFANECLTKFYFIVYSPILNPSLLFLIRKLSQVLFCKRKLELVQNKFRGVSIGIVNLPFHQIK